MNTNICAKDIYTRSININFRMTFWKPRKRNEDRAKVNFTCAYNISKNISATIVSEKNMATLC